MKNSKVKNQKSKVKKTQSKSQISSSEPLTMEELLIQTNYTLHTYKKGDKVTGKVISVSPGEVLIDVSGKSYAQIAQRELENIRDVINNLKIGDEITGTVISTENDMGYLVLSVKSLGYDKKWDLLDDKLKENKEVEVKGLELAKGGLLVEYNGLRGYIPASQLDPSYMADPRKLIGEKIKVKILELNKQNTRFVVSQKAVTQKDILSKQKDALEIFEVGGKYPAQVTGTAPFGIFVLVPAKEKGIEIEGLVHISEIAWEKVDDPQKYVKTGDKIEVAVIGIDKNANRLNLSIKQLTPDPWKDIDKKYKVEQQVSGIISRVSSFGAFMTIENGVAGLIHISKIPPGEEPKEGDKVDCVIESIDSLKRKISLSLIPKGKPVGYR